MSRVSTLSLSQSGRVPATSVVLASLLLAASAAEAQLALPPIGPSAVEGHLWNDLNGNGWADAHEPGLPGVTIYADTNENGRRDAGEPSVVSTRDDPRTRMDETGRYSLTLAPGQHRLRLVLPRGAETTYPSGGHLVSIGFSHLVDGIDFGVSLTTVGRISGVVWDDGNRDGVRDPNEPGLAGVTVYADINRNCLFDEGDIAALSAEDDPSTTDDESGMYWLTGLSPGQAAIRIVQPPDAFPVAPAEALHAVYVPIDEGVFDVDFGLKAVPQQFFSMNVDRLDIEPTSALTVVEDVEITIAPLCVLPYELDVIPSDRWALVENLDGIQLNGCGGDTTTFSMAFRATAAVQCYQLEIRDPDLSGVLMSIPVRVPEPATGLSLAVGLLGLARLARFRSSSATDGRG